MLFDAIKKVIGMATRCAAIVTEGGLEHVGLGPNVLSTSLRERLIRPLAQHRATAGDGLAGKVQKKKKNNNLTWFTLRIMILNRM